MECRAFGNIFEAPGSDCLGSSLSPISVARVSYIFVRDSIVSNKKLRFGKDLIESAQEALAIASGVAPAAREIVETIEVAAIRKRLRLVQDQFIRRFALSVAAVRDWE
jgi:hypothetical protein